MAPISQLVIQPYTDNTPPDNWINLPVAPDGAQQRRRPEVFRIGWRGRWEVILPIERLSPGREVGPVSLPRCRAASVNPKAKQTGGHHQNEQDHQSYRPIRFTRTWRGWIRF